MGRVNKFTEGVFTDIVGTSTNISKFDKFINVQDTLKEAKGDLKKFMEEYTSKVNENKNLFNELALLEDVIMQIRTKENLSIDNIKINTVREYIYARTSFHRKDITCDDVRVIVGQTDQFGSDVQKLSGNKKFMELAKNKLIESMDEIINHTKSKFK